MHHLKLLKCNSLWANPFASHPTSFLPTSTPSFRTLSHSERHLEEIGIQISHREITRKNEILEVKEEKGTRKTCKLPPKKRGHLQKKNIVVKESLKKKAKQS